MPHKGFSYCERHRQGFSNSEALNRHIIEKHQKFECPVCHRRFENKTGIRLHMAVHYKDKPTTEKQ